MLSEEEIKELTPDNFNPSLKEQNKSKFYFENGNWIKCDESKISELWRRWSGNEQAERYNDKDGFLVFGYKKAIEPQI